jgi:hypothetical protein
METWHPEPRRFVRAAILAGLTGAILIDAYLSVTHAFIFHDATPLEVSQWDASNVLGRAAFQGGWPAAGLGFLLHLAVSLFWATLFVFAATRLKALVDQPILWGAVYGVLVMLVMRFAVVPLGHAALGATSPAALINVSIAHVLSFGIPVALVTRRFL